MEETDQLADRRSRLRTVLGPVGVWTFALQTHGASAERAAIVGYESLGYRATWFPESVGSKEAFSHAALLLAGSPRVVVATGIANLYARDRFRVTGERRADVVWPPPARL